MGTSSGSGRGEERSLANVAGRARRGGGGNVDQQRAVVETPVGPVGIEAAGGAVVRVWFARGESLLPPRGGLLTEAARQLGEYFRGERREFTLPLRRPSAATAFQNRLWDALERIPLGQTRTYGELAAELGTSARAVGGACARNPLPLLIPCHRVRAKAGLGGFNGDWEKGLAVDVKQVLLEHEARVAGPS
ncbi:MAG: methylated-DNA--[protein]-cysteine S-methyltransferase [Proteobacteria bacterium]|nr:methylated-DNA--[protein]-cysteine S-methyltransferase [Pseudomonadota bacterium]